MTRGHEDFKSYFNHFPKKNFYKFWNGLSFGQQKLQKSYALFPNSSSKLHIHDRPCEFRQLLRDFNQRVNRSVAKRRIWNLSECSAQHKCVSLMQITRINPLVCTGL